MDATSNLATVRAFNILVKGRDIDRFAVYTSLDDPDQAIDHAQLRSLIIDALTRVYVPIKGEQEQDTPVKSRRWLVGALGRISGDDTKAKEVVRIHLNVKTEPDRWVRYEALASLIAAKATDIEELAYNIIDNDKNPWPYMLAIAILASKGDRHAMSELLKNLKSGEKPVATLRALRTVPIPEALGDLIRIVKSSNLDKGYCEDATYDAIVALGCVPSEWPQATEVANVLENAIKLVRRFSWLVHIRALALRAIGNLKVKSSSSLLVEELENDNANIIFEASRALQQVLGTRIAVARIVEVASGADREYIEGYASALRWMNREAVVEELETAMVSGPPNQRETARILLVEIGGMAAFQKVRARTEALAQYRTELEKAEDKIRILFDTSIMEAQKGFRRSTYMDTTVFLLGILLIATSAGIVIVNGGNLDNWAGVGTTGIPGVLGIIYGTLIRNPRRQIERAVDHLMHLKIIFLGYLRQLHQVDQAYTQRMLEDKHLTTDEVDSFSQLVKEIMDNAVKQLSILGSASATAPSKYLPQSVS